ncbi:unnamed protein product, partial [Adineta steineri]
AFEELVEKILETPSLWEKTEAAIRSIDKNYSDTVPARCSC